MSSVSATYSWLVCDGCRAVHPRPGRVLSQLREHAAKAGWKHVVVEYGTKKSQRQIDLCSSCEEPQFLF